MAMTPTRYPELDLPQRWREDYDRMRARGYNQTLALKVISRAYGDVPVTTIRTCLFVEERQNRRDYMKRYNAAQRDTVGTRKEYMQAYKRARRHLDEFITQAYDRLAPPHHFTLIELSNALHDLAGVRLSPATILQDCNTYEQQRGTPLLRRVQGRPARYALSTGHVRTE